MNETPIAADPYHPSHLISGGNDYNCDSIAGFFISTDGRSTWTHSCLPLLPGASGDGDPIVGWEPQGTAYAGEIDLFSDHSDIAVAHSTDGGATWSPPVSAVHQDGLVMDKPWLEIDNNPGSPFLHSLYVSVTKFAPFETNSQISVSHSTDGGVSWQLVDVDTTQNGQVSVDQFSDLAIGSDGTVYLTWLRCPPTGPAGDCGDTIAAMYFSKSTDGGNTWSAPRVIHKVHLAPDSCGGFYGCLPNAPERVSDIPVVAVDASATSTNGWLYVIDYSWANSRMRVRVASSGDGGFTWGSPVAVTKSRSDQFFPWINVSPTGTVGASWLDQREDPSHINYDAFAAFSNDGGTTFGANLRLSSASSNPNNDGFGGEFMGDYTGNTWTSGASPRLLVSWTDTRNGTAQDWVGGAVP